MGFSTPRQTQATRYALALCNHTIRYTTLFVYYGAISGDIYEHDFTESTLRSAH